MTVQAERDLAVILEPARAALDDDALVARSVRLARSRTLRAARGEPSRRPAAWRASRLLGLLGLLGGKRGFALAGVAVAVASWLVLARTTSWRGNVAAPAAISYSIGPAPAVLGEALAAEAPRTLDFTDGTRVEHAPGGAMRVVSLDERGGRLVIEQGTIHAAFRHRDTTYWTVEAGGVVVEVTGTRFDVQWDPTAKTFDLEMHEGSVRIHGCGVEQGRVVKDVERIHASCAGVVPASTPAGASAPIVPLVTVTPSELPSVPVAPSVPVSAPAAPTAAVLLERADAQRRAHDSNAARATLLDVRQRFPGGREAAQAAFDLGVVAFDLDDRFADAAAWFRRYLVEAPSGPLAREASGRLVEALDRGGDSASAAKAAARYLEMYPGGPHASLAKRLVAPSP
jgi:ferric-dicitrate binding protein FerR (iron transport regulator)